MAAPADAPTSPQQAIGQGEAAPASLAALFAEAAASAEGGAAEVLRAYGEARGRFGAAQRDAAARTRLQAACVPAGPLLDTLMAHLDSANLSLCAHACLPVSRCIFVHHVDAHNQHMAFWLRPCQFGMSPRPLAGRTGGLVQGSTQACIWYLRPNDPCCQPCRNHGAAELSGWLLAEPAFVTDCAGVRSNLKKGPASFPLQNHQSPCMHIELCCGTCHAEDELEDLLQRLLDKLESTPDKVRGG